MTSPLYLLDADTGRVICGPTSSSADDWQASYPHQRLTLGPYPGHDDGDPDAWVRALADRHGLPNEAASPFVVLRERPAEDVLHAYERCSGGFLCRSTHLVLVTWHGRDDGHRAIGGRPRVWWRRVLCGEHLAEPLHRLIDRSLRDPSPDSPRDIGVLVAVGPEWGIRWAHGRVDPQPSQAEARRFAGIAAGNGGVLVTRPGPDAEWADAPAAVAS